MTIGLAGFVPAFPMARWHWWRLSLWGHEGKIMDKTEDKLARAREQAMAQFRSITEMVANLRAADDDDAYEELAPTLAADAGFAVVEVEGGWSWMKQGDPDETRHDSEAEAWLACCDDNGLRPDTDEARRTIEEDALSVQIRSGWHSPGEAGEAEEYEILLCTGGPAVRIVGDLGRFNEPDDARLQCQDWFTSWTEVFDVDHDVLLAYAHCFYFGD